MSKHHKYEIKEFGRLQRYAESDREREVYKQIEIKSYKK